VKEETKNYGNKERNKTKEIVNKKMGNEMQKIDAQRMKQSKRQ
jgi:hypothetical protein